MRAPFWPAPRRSVRRRVLLLVAAVAVIGCAGWLFVTAWLANREVDSLRSAMTGLQSHIGAGDVSKASTDADVVRRHARHAHALTTGPIWWIAAHVPVAGDPLRTVRGSTEQVDRIAGDALPQVITVAQDLSPTRLRTSSGIDVAPLRAAAPSLQRAAEVAATASLAMAELPRHTWIPSVNDARDQLALQLAKVSDTLGNAHRAADVLPDMLGERGQRRYFIGLENEAESRGLGGLPGAFAIVTANHGTIRVTSFQNDDAMYGARASVRLDPGYRARWSRPDPAATFVNSTIGPHFPDAAAIWAGMWQAKTGERIDGAIAVDPTALGYLLATSAGATLPDGRHVEAGTLAKLTQRDIYARFTDNTARKQYLIQIARAVTDSVFAHSASYSVWHAAARAADERRLLIWSRDPATESVLEQTPFGGTAQATGRPFSGFTVNNAAGSKLDYYLRRTISYARTGCGATRAVTATTTLTNTAPRSGLPAYVTTRADKRTSATRPGDNRLLVSYYGTAASSVDSVTLDGVPVPVSTGTEHGLLALTADVEMPAGASRTLVVHLTEPTLGGPVTIVNQPLVQLPTVSASEQTCG